VASNILLDLDEKYFRQLPPQALIDGLNSMANSKYSVATATASSIAKKFPLENLPENLQEFVRRNTSTHVSTVATDRVVLYALQEATTSVVSRDKLPFPNSAIFSLLFVPIFGSIWGKFMWEISSTSNPLYRKLKSVYGADQTEPLRKRFVATRRIGLALFVLLECDLLASMLPSLLSGREIPFIGAPLQTEWKDQQLTVLYPTLQTGLFTLISIGLINKYRFVMIPLVCATLINHHDLLVKYGLVSEYVVDTPKRVLKNFLSGKIN